MKKLTNWRKVLRVKPLDSFEEDFRQCQLRRIHGRWGLTAIGVGAIIGGGIMTLTGIAAHEYAGPALILSFALAGICCAFTSLCYAEFASILPVEGSAYSYSYGTVGEVFAWFVGWNLILEYMMGATSVAVSWSGHLESFLALFHIKLPLLLTNDPYTAREKLGLETLPFAINLPAFLVVWLITGVALRGAKGTALVNNFLVALKIAIVLFVILVGAFYVDPANWRPFIPEKIVDMYGASHFGVDGVLTAASIVFFAYLGFDVATAHAGEAINPKKDVPFAIFVSLLVCTILYILVSLVLTGMEPYAQLDLKAPVAYAFMHKGLPWAVVIVDLAAIMGLLSVVLVLISAQSRIFLGMARDGLLPARWFGVVHPKYKTPYRSTMLVGMVISLVAALTPIQKISEMCSMGTLFAFAMICGAVWLLRILSPEIQRQYRAPWLPFVSLMGISVNLFLMTRVRSATWQAFLLWSALGAIVYFAYSRRHSKIQG